MKEVLGPVGADEVREIPGQRPFWIDGQRFKGGSEQREREHPPPHLATNAARLRVLRWPQPKGVAHARPYERPLFPPDHHERQHEYPDEASVEADQQRSTERLTAAKAIPKPGGDDPRKQAHRDGRRGPQANDLGEGVLLYGLIAIGFSVDRLCHGLSRGGWSRHRGPPFRG
jgi:hypothetical protein